MPRSPLGLLSACLLAASALLAFAFFTLVAGGRRGGDTLAANPLLATTFLGAGLCAMAAGVVGVAGFVSTGERSPVVLAAIACAVAVAALGIGGVIAPH